MGGQTIMEQDSHSFYSNCSISDPDPNAVTFPEEGNLISA